MYFPLGPCNIYFDGMDLGFTLKEEKTSLEIKVKTEEIKTDESIEIKGIIELGKDITFESTLFFEQEVLQKLQIDRFLTSLVKEGDFRIVSLDKKFTILLPRVKLILEPIFNFKNDKVNKIKLKAIALNTKNNKKIELNFGVDMPNKLSVRIKEKNLMLYVPDDEKVPILEVKNKKLVYSQNAGDLVFKIVNGHLVKILE